MFICAVGKYGGATKGPNREGHGRPRKETYSRRVAKEGARVERGKWWHLKPRRFEGPSELGTDSSSFDVEH